MPSFISNFKMADANKMAALEKDTPSRTAIIDTPFVNEMRLSSWHWAFVLGAVVITVLLTPRLWKQIERFETGPDYRIPYSLSKDYWLYERRIDQLAPTNIVLIGDSVVWGEYVLPDGTLSHFLNQESVQRDRFVNGGVNGLFPLALEGLIRHYATSLRSRKIILHCNVLWMSSPKADLQTEKEEKFNHAHLVPQFDPRVPCYKADFDERLTVVVERNFGFMQWANHLQSAYFNQKNILSWTLEDDGKDPPRYPNAYKNPFTQIALTVLSAPKDDPDRGPASPRHKPWSNTGKGTTRFEWVESDRSLQWAAFLRLVGLLQSRGNEVLVVLGPFNEHLMIEESRQVFRRLRENLAAQFASRRIAFILPETLPSELYADASHPLTEGYRRLARELLDDKKFQTWLGGN